MNFDKVGQDWSRVTFSLDQDTPQDSRVEMFVRRHDVDGQERYDIGWAEEFKSENSCSFKPMDIIAQETGIAFDELGIEGDLSQIHALEGVTRKDVIWFHTVSRFWSVKNGLMHKIKLYDSNAEGMHSAQAQDQQEAIEEKERILNEKIKKLEKMTFKVLKQNMTIYKTIKKQGQKSKTFIQKLFG